MLVTMEHSTRGRLPGASSCAWAADVRPELPRTGSGDLDWILDTATLLTAAETYLLITRLHGWPLDTYETCLRRTLAQLVGAGRV